MTSSTPSSQPSAPGTGLQDQPDFYGAVDSGFAVFCREPAPTGPLELLGPEVVDAIQNGFNRSSLRAPFGARQQIAAGMIAAAIVSSFILPFGSGYAFIPIILAVVGLWRLLPWLNSVFVWHGARREPSMDELQTLAPSEQQRANVRALEEYRQLLSEDPTRLSCETRDAGDSSLTPNELRGLKADHGRQLLISSDRRGWVLVRPPLPRGRLMVRLNGARAKCLLSSRLLMLEGDDALFETRMQWIIRQTNALEKGSKALINGIAHIRYLRQQRLAGLALKDVIDELDTEMGLKGEMAQKLWSGNHADFEKALKKLPLESMP
ncbi:MAG: hypothetical protein AAFY19_00505 [Pseudomonadota bacterium]